MPWRRRHFVKRAVDAIADFEFVFERLKVNVARSVQDRLVKDEIDKANDRRCVCFRFDRGLAVFLAQLQKLASFAELLENLIHAGGIAAIMLLDQFFDLIGRRNHYLNVFTERETEVLCSMGIKRLGQRDSEW